MHKITGIILILFLLASCNHAPATQAPVIERLKGSIALDLGAHQAGKEMTISITMDSKNIEPILLLNQKFGNQILPIQKTEQGYKAFLNKEQNIIAGQLEFTLIAQGQVIDQKSIYVEGLQAEDKIEAYAGPKTVFATDVQKSMIVAIPRDRYGNAMETRALADFSAQHENGTKIQHQSASNNLINYMIIPNLKTSGKILIGGTSGEAFIPEQEIKIESGAPFQVDFEVEKIYPYADERQNVHIKTGIVKDAANEMVADGSMLTFIVQDQTGKQSMYQGFTVSGIANIYLQNPAAPTQWSIRIEEDKAPNPKVLTLNFSTNVNEIPFRIEEQVLKVGPIKGALNQLIPDGSILQLEGNCNGYSIFKKVETEFGMANIPVKEICDKTFKGTLQIQGFSKSIQF